MKKRTYTEKEIPKRDENLSDLIHDALIEKGWLVPQTEEDILRAESALVRIERPLLPPDLLNPYRIIDRLDDDLAIAAEMTSTGINNGLYKTGTTSRQLLSSRLSEEFIKKGKPQNLAYAYVSDELLDDEATTDAMKCLILAVRHLTRAQRYEEALELAKLATEIDPNYWRAWNSYGSLLTLVGNLDEGEAIFRRVAHDFSDNPKAVAVALHNCAFAKEVRCEFEPSEENSQEILRDYGRALSLHEGSTNTRASLFINTVLSCQPDEGRRLIEDFLECEDFLGDMALETEEREARGVKTYRFLQVLPITFRNRLYDAGPGHLEVMGPA